MLSQGRNKRTEPPNVKLLIFTEMNTTIIKTAPELKKEILNFAKSLNTPMRPVVAFGWDDESMVVSGCPTPCLSPMLERYASQMEVVAML